MHHNLLWRAFLVTIFVIVFGYSVLALYRVHQFSKLTSETKPLKMKWSVKEIADDEHMIQGNYTFEANEKTYQGEAVLKKSIYRNGWAAEQDLPKYDKEKWTVWYDPANPDYSALQKSFPLKECISALVLWALFFYFTWLGFYVGRFKT